MGSNPVISRAVRFCLLDINWKNLEKKWKNMGKMDISLLSQGFIFITQGFIFINIFINILAILVESEQACSLF